MEQMPFITLAQCQAAMAAMLEAAQKKPEHPVAMAIVDSTGFLINYQEMDRLRMFTKTHAIRKAYTAAITGMNSGAHGEWTASRGLTVRELGGDLQLTPVSGAWSSARACMIRTISTPTSWAALASAAISPGRKTRILR